MKIYSKFTLTLFCIIALTGCEKNNVELTSEKIQVIKQFVVAPQILSGQRSFPAVVQAHKRADLSFGVPGKVTEIYFKEGVDAKRGQVIARLDNSDFLNVLNDRKANYKRAKADLERSTEMLGKGFISKTEHERLKAQLASEEAALNQAQLNLEYTEIKAPFDGTLSRRYIERFEEVQAKQMVFNFADTSALVLIVDIPENLVQQYNHGNIEVTSYALFSTSSDKHFPITFKEFSTKADAQTQTFQASFSMNQPDDLIVLPGMTATVVLSVELKTENSTRFVVPLSAVVGSSDLNTQVWVVNPETMQVSAKKVKVGRLGQKNIEIISGVENKDILVASGANYLREGQIVRFMKVTEQADPKTVK
jgi:RND family efflux transporter MFP subunit